MKKIVCIVFLTLTNVILLNAQESNIKPTNSKIGITFSSFGENDVFRFNELDGAASYDRDGFYTLGINYILGLNKWIEIETALEYSKQNIIINPNVSPDTDSSPRKANLSLINIPITLRVNFLKYCFINGGTIIDVDASIDSPIDTQTGLGAILGIGIKYDFDFGISVFVNPYTKVHSLIPFADSDHHQSIWENGFRFGVTYDLRK